MIALPSVRNGDIQFGHIAVIEVVTAAEAGMGFAELRQIEVHAPTGDAVLIQVFHQQADRAAYVQSVGVTKSTDDLRYAPIKRVAVLLIDPDEFWILVRLPIVFLVFQGNIVPVVLPSLAGISRSPAVLRVKPDQSRRLTGTHQRRRRRLEELKVVVRQGLDSRKQVVLTRKCARLYSVA
jgi:hypothetical protein